MPRSTALPRVALLRATRRWAGLVALAVGLFATPSVRAYEGAAEPKDQPAPEPPKPPQLTKPPAVTKFIEADYPPELLGQNVSGAVRLVITIDAEGHCPEAIVTESSGQPAFDDAAVAALKRFEFSPAEFDGKPGPVRLEYIYRFAPKAPPPPPEPPPEAPKPPPAVNLKGTVLERGTRDPLSNAVVFIVGTELSTETDAEGRFELRGVPVGKVKIEITEPSHQKFSTEEEIRENEVTELTAYAWKLVEGAFTATIRGKRDKKEVSRRTLERAELTSVPGTFGDPVRVIQNLPGVARPAFIGGALLVRGAQPQDTGIYIDGVPIPLLYHFGGGPSVVNPNFIDKIDFIPGAYGSKYGRAIAGVVDVTTKPPAPKRLHGSFDVDLLDSGFYVEGPVWQDKPELGTFAISARRSYYDLFIPLLLSATVPPGSGQVVATPYYWDYQARYDVKLGPGQLEVVGFGSNDRLEASLIGNVDTQAFSLGTEQGFHRFRLKWSQKLEDGLTFYVAPTMGPTIVSFNLGDSLKGDIRSFDVNLRSALVKEFSPALKVESGLDVNANFTDLDFLLPNIPEYQTFPGESPDLGTQHRVFSLPLSTQALYADAIWNPFGGLKLIPGIRGEIYNLPKASTFSLEPRLAVRYEFSDEMAVKAAWGLFRQAPQAQNLDEQFGNPYLGLAQSSQTVIGFERTLLPKLTLDVQAFFNWRTQLVVASNEVVTRPDGTVTRERFKNGGYGQAYGLEILLKQEVTERMFGWIAYTLSRSEQKSDSESEKAGTWVFLPVSFDQTHNLIIVGSYKLDGGWELGARFRLTSGRPTTPVLGSTYDADTNGYPRVNGAPNSARGAWFHQLDLRVEKLFTYEQWRLSAYLDIQNVYNAENPEQTLYNYRASQSAPLRGLPFLPTLGVTGAF